jgi:hypothetical protein
MVYLYTDPCVLTPLLKKKEKGKKKKQQQTFHISIQQSAGRLRPKELGVAGPPSLPPEACGLLSGLEWGGCVSLSLSLSLLHFCDSNDELMLPHFSLFLHNSPTKGGSATLLVSGR